MPRHTITKPTEKLNLVEKLKCITEGLVEGTNVRYRPREEVKAKLFEAYKILDRIRKLEKDVDAADIQEEASRDNPKFRKARIQKFLAWLNSNGVNTDKINIEFIEEQSRYVVFTRNPCTVDQEIFRIPSSVIFSSDNLLPSDGDDFSLKDFGKVPGGMPVYSEEFLVGKLVVAMYVNKPYPEDFKVYLNMLPTIKAHTHPMCFGKDEILKIQYFENLFCDSVIESARVMMNYSTSYFGWNESQLEPHLTFRRFLWARLTVDLYSTTIFRTDDKGTLISSKSSLVPLLDMCEFQRDKEPLFDLKYFEGDVDDYVCISLQDGRAGSPILRNYANPSFYACFVDYGFVPYILGSGMEMYRLALDLTPSKDKYCTRKVGVIQTLGFSDNELFDIQLHDLSDCHSKLSNVAMRLFFYINVIRGNLALLDLIERGESDLTFLAKPTRMTWLYLAVKLRIKETILRDKLVDLYLSYEKGRRKARGIILTGRVKVLFLYVMNEFNSVHALEKVIKKQIQDLGPDKPEIRNQFDCAETVLRKLYEQVLLQTDICDTTVELKKGDSNSHTLRLKIKTSS